MSAFDPYHKWLGIPKSEQPPHHYRLLGIALYEADPEVIEAAADRQMTYIRQCATGPYTSQSQQILNELSAARVCLLNADKKKAYDGELRARLAPPEPPPPPAAKVVRPRVTRIPAERQPAAEEPEADDYSLMVLQKSVAEEPVSLPPRRRGRKRKTSPVPFWLLGAAGLLLLGGIIYAVIQPGGEPAQSADQKTAAVEIKVAEKRRKAPGGADEKQTKRPADAPPTDDLLKRIALPQNAVRGTWRFDGTTLVSPSTDFCRLQVPVTPPESYILRATVETASIRDCLCLGLVTGTTQVTAVFNGWQGTTSGLQLVNMRMVPINETKFGPVLVAGRPNEIVCKVTPGRIEITCNGKPFVNWSGDFNRLQAGPDWEPPNKRQLFLGTNLTSYRISRLELERLVDSRSSAAVIAAPKNVNEWRVLEARYGTEGSTIDLTERLRRASQSGSLVVVVDPVLSGGKFSGELFVRIQGGDAPQQEIRKGGGDVFYFFPSYSFSAANEPPEVLTILSAKYGTGIWTEEYMIDARELLTARIVNERVSVPVKELVARVRDPAPGKAKVLVVYCQFGRFRTFRTFQEDATVELGRPH